MGSAVSFILPPLPDSIQVASNGSQKFFRELRALEFFFGEAIIPKLTRYSFVGRWLGQAP